MRLKTIRVLALIMVWWTAGKLGWASESPPLLEALAAAATGTGTNSPAAVEEDLDINKLADRLRSSSAIGVFTKLALKNEVDDLLDNFRRFHAGRNELLAELRDRYNLLLMKITSLLQDRDPKLSKDIFNARAVLWAKLVDPKEFSKMT